MSEAALLALLVCCPDRVAVARRVRAAALHDGLHRLEAAGLVVARSNRYRVTRRGRMALEFDRRLDATVRRALRAA